LVNQVLLDALDAALAQVLVKGLRAAIIRVGFNRQLRIRIVLQVLLEAIRESRKRQLLAANEPDLGMLLVWIVRGVEHALQGDRRNRLNRTSNVHTRGLRGLSAADVGGVQSNSLGFVNRAWSSAVWN